MANALIKNGGSKELKLCARKMKAAQQKKINSVGRENLYQAVLRSGFGLNELLDLSSGRTLPSSLVLATLTQLGL